MIMQRNSRFGFLELVRVQLFAKGNSINFASWKVVVMGEIITYYLLRKSDWTGQSDWFDREPDPSWSSHLL